MIFALCKQSFSDLIAKGVFIEIIEIVFINSLFEKPMNFHNLKRGFSPKFSYFSSPQLSSKSTSFSKKFISQNVYHVKILISSRRMAAFERISPTTFLPDFYIPAKVYLNPPDLDGHPTRIKNLNGHYSRARRRVL